LVSENISQSLLDIHLFGRPIEDTKPFEILVFNKKINKLFTLFYNLEDEDLKDLKNFSNFSGYCNAKNKLYISGGESASYKSPANTTNNNSNNITNEKRILNMFYSIDMETGKIERLKDLLDPRVWHSMIYVPDNYIFLVGGLENRTVDVYDIKKNTFSRENNLNEPRFESTLCCVNSEYLYAFYGYLHQQNYSDSIERLPFHVNARKWELLSLKEGSIPILTRFFGVSLVSDSKVLILGGNTTNSEDVNNPQNMGNMSNYSNKVLTYDFNTNSITNAQDFKFEFLIGEKFFFEVQLNKYLMFTLNDQTSAYLFNEMQLHLQDLSDCYDENENKIIEYIKEEKEIINNNELEISPNQQEQPSNK